MVEKESAVDSTRMGGVEVDAGLAVVRVRVRVRPRAVEMVGKLVERSCKAWLSPQTRRRSRRS